MLAIVAMARFLVWQAGMRAVTPLLYFAIACVLVLGAWLLIDTAAVVASFGN